MPKSNYILLDAARMDGYIYVAKDMNVDHRCLYEGDSEKFLGSSAPWLFDLDGYSMFSEWISEHAPGKSWGILFESDGEQEEVYRHLRKFLIVHTEEGKELYFRYYDPRVLRVFLPTCDTEQLLEFFGPIASFIMEDEKGMMTRFSLDGAQLKVANVNCDLSTYVLSEEAPSDNEKDVITERKEVQKGESNWDFGYG